MTSLRDELETIYQEHGRLTPSLVLETARDPQHPLHGRFEWNDSVAAERYRLEQAHELIVEVRIEYKDSDGAPKSVRRYHALRAADDAQYDYFDEADIRSDPFKKKLLLQSMQREWKTLEARYHEQVEFWDLVRRSLRKRKTG